MVRLRLAWRRFHTRLPKVSVHSAKRRSRLLWLAPLSVLALALTVLWLDANLRPVVTRLATAQVHHLATAAINDAVNECVLRGGVRYESVIHFEKDVNGQITALKTDMSAINRLRSEIAQTVQDRIQNIGTSELAIPLGNVFSGELLSGRGPSIPVKLVPVGAVDTAFDNVFSAAGINQTRHQIVLHVKVTIGVLLPGYKTDSEVDVTVALAETVIVGAVPDTYASLDDKVFAIDD